MDPVLKSKIVSIELFKGTKAMPIVGKLSIQLSLVYFLLKCDFSKSSKRKVQTN